MSDPVEQREAASSPEGLMRDALVVTLERLAGIAESYGKMGKENAAYAMLSGMLMGAYSCLVVALNMLDNLPKLKAIYE